MKRILFIAAHRLNRSPSQRYRYEQYLDYLKENGYEITHSHIISQSDDVFFYSKGRFLLKAGVVLKSVFIRIKDWFRFNNYDVVFIQREALMLGTSFFEKCAYKSKTKVVFDFDDSIWLLDTSPGNKKLEWLKNPDKTKTNIQHAHLVIAGNSYLANYAKQYNPNTIVIPTTIDTKFHTPTHDLRHKENKVVIGWSGSISTIKHFEHALPFLTLLKQKYGDAIDIQVVGDDTYVNKTLDIQGIKWEAKREVELLNQFDIGIMSLPDDEWAKGKCGLKGLSYMACEIPTIMSPVGVNTEIIEHGVNGYLASTIEEWVNYLSLLIESKDLRLSIGKAGRETVVKKYSVEANKQRYLLALDALIKTK